MIEVSFSENQTERGLTSCHSRDESRNLLDLRDRGESLGLEMEESLFNRHPYFMHDIIKRKSIPWTVIHSPKIRPLEQCDSSLNMRYLVTMGLANH